ncbi:MFS transporter [Paenibacillus sp. HW567]|uniref:MFS transporter n=1 Tax=Paenibacillus sp. HW567 TaxID=1034769 RepID=UPI0003760760|nr:MFS transporter [Paenibacillus sp. HW567]
MKNALKIYMLALISFLVGTSQFSIVGMLDKVAEAASVSVSTAGQLVTVFAIGNAIGSPLIIVATAKMNQRNQLLMALGIIVLGIASMLALPGFGFLMASRIITGAGTGVFVVSAYAIAAKLASPGRQGGAMSTVAMGYSSSLVFGVPIGRIVAVSHDWRTIFWAIGILSLLAIFTVARTIPALGGEVAIPLSKRFAHLKNPKVTVTLGITFFIFINYSIINTYITPYLASALPEMKERISAILLAMGIASLIGSRLGGFLADRFGTNRTIRASMTVQIVALLLLALNPGWTFATILLLMLWEIACWTFGPTQNYNLMSLAPEASGILLSLNSSFVQLGFAAGAGIGGITTSGLSVMDITWISAIAVLIAGGVSQYVSRVQPKAKTDC